MATRTPQQLNDLIDHSLAWRKKEMINIYNNHGIARGHQQEMLRRAGVALLYAHWEGFVKESATSYLEMVSRTGERVGRLRVNFIGIAARAHIHQLSVSSKGRMLCEAADYFMNSGMDQKFFVKADDIVSTAGNLRSDVFDNLLHLLGLPSGGYALDMRTVIDPLVRDRNNIAHGQYLAVDKAAYARYHDGVIRLLGRFANDVLTAAWSRGYLSSPVPSD